MVSIIIRTKNEERWISEVLDTVFAQEYKDFEVIIVDNKSIDNTIKKASKYDVKILNIERYSPGKALNLGIENSKGEYIACLSAHCIPVSDKWLGSLLSNFNSNKVAGVYGRQEPMEFSSDSDKRDLLTVFGLDRKVQKKDSFFHNANSMIRRDLWEEYSFNEDLTNIEDREWAQHFLNKGYSVVYEPSASVYHHHGIHQNGDIKRCTGVVRVLEKIKVIKDFGEESAGRIQNKDIACFVPVKGPVLKLKGKPLIEYTLEHALGSDLINKIFVLTEDNGIKNIAENMGAVVPFMRSSEEQENLDDMLKISLEKIEKDLAYVPDIVVIMWITFPFRGKGYIDRLISKLVNSDFDSVIPVMQMHEICWQEEQKDKYIRVDSGHVPRGKRKKVYVGVEGLGYVTYPDCIKNNSVHSDNVGIVEIKDPVAGIKVRDPEDIALGEVIADNFVFHADNAV